MATQSWLTSGTYTWVLPANIDVTQPISVDLSGAGGGGPSELASGGTGKGGTGGKVTGTISIASLTPGVSLIQFRVGGKGGTQSGNTGGTGGSNSGGRGGNGNGGSGRGGCGGGGPTDVRFGAFALADRYAVAAGGGGAPAADNVNGGDGGAASGMAGGGGGGIGGGGGSPSAGGGGGTGAGNGVAGSLGTGGRGGDASTTPGWAGGGGGGGYYGGGGGGGSASKGADGSGAGGSNYTGGMLATPVSTRGAGSLQNVDGKAILTWASLPNAPTVTPGAAQFDVTLAESTQFTFSSPDVGDAISLADIRWRIGAGAWTTVSGLLPVTNFTDISGGAGTSFNYNFAANYFVSVVNQLVEFQARVYGQFGNAGPWSGSAYATPRNPPGAATLTTPVIDSNTPQVIWTTPTAMVNFEIKVTDAAGTTLLSDKTGTSSGTSWTTTANSYSYTSGTSYQIGVRYQAIVGIWSPWAMSGAVAANINAPLQPVCVTTPIEESASVYMTITNPAGDPHPPSHNDLYRASPDGTEIRIATNLGLNTTYTDWTVGFGLPYRYRVVAVTATGAFTSST